MGHHILRKAIRQMKKPDGRKESSQGSSDVRPTGASWPCKPSSQQGNRMKFSQIKELEEIVIVPTGSFALDLDADLSSFFLFAKA